MSPALRLLLGAAASFTLACAGNAVDDLPEGPTVSDDLDQLRQQLAVPAASSSARWVMDGDALLAFFPGEGGEGLGIEVSSTATSSPGPRALAALIDIDPDQDGALASCGSLPRGEWRCAGAMVSLEGTVIYVTRP